MCPRWYVAQVGVRLEWEWMGSPVCLVGDFSMRVLQLRKMEALKEFGGKCFKMLYLYLSSYNM